MPKGVYRRRSIRERVLVQSNGCWEWVAGRNSKGYGLLYSKSQDRLLYAHRAFYTVFVAPIPDGLQIDHLCRNPSCVNPRHLEVVTHQENLARGKFGRKTHCVHGHPFDLLNTYYRRDRNERMCRACHNERNRKRRSGPLVRAARRRRG